MKVYVITRGYYSDYEICAVTTDKRKAQVLKKKFSRGHSMLGPDTRIEEYDTEQYEFALKENAYYVDFDKSGSVRTAKKCTPDEMTDGLYCRDNKSIYVHVLAQNKEAAIKIAAEKRAMYLAEKEGVI